MCYLCGKAGHFASACPNVAQDNPDARQRKRDDEDDAARVALSDGEETSWNTDDWAGSLDDDHLWDAAASFESVWLVDGADALTTTSTEQLRGCAVIDIGCARSVAPIHSADPLRAARLSEEDEVWQAVTPSTKHFHFCEWSDAPVPLAGRPTALIWPLCRFHVDVPRV
eukprot:6706978-Lingulodinium_polyedra.AAC.1